MSDGITLHHNPSGGPLSRNSDLNRNSHYYIKRLTVKEIVRIENMIIQVKLS